MVCDRINDAAHKMIEEMIRLGGFTTHEQVRKARTDAAEAYAQCLTEARQAQKDHDAGKEGNNIVAGREQR